MLPFAICIRRPQCYCNASQGSYSRIQGVVLICAGFHGNFIFDQSPKMLIYNIDKKLTPVPTLHNAVEGKQ